MHQSLFLSILALSGVAVLSGAQASGSAGSGYALYSTDKPGNQDVTYASSKAVSMPKSGHSRFDSWYVGGNLGMNLLSAGFKMVYNGTGGKANHGGNLLQGNALFGYGQLLDTSYYLGAELNAGHRLSGRIKNGNFIYGSSAIYSVDRVKPTWNAGLSAKIGKQVAPKVLPYVLLGAAVSHFKVKSIDTIAEIYPSLEKTRWGLRAGFGVEVAAFGALNLDMRYVREHYQGINHVDSSGNSLKITPNTNLVAVGLTYHF